MLLKFGKAAMNDLYTFAYVVTETQLSPFGFAAYEAFDAGELDVDGDSRTRDFLRRAVIELTPSKIESPSALGGVEADGARCARLPHC